MIDLKIVNEKGEGIGSFDSIVQVTAWRFKKGEEVYGESLEDLHLGDWESSSEEIVKTEPEEKMKGEGEFKTFTEADTRFIHDFIGLSFCVMGNKSGEHFDSGLVYEVMEGLGYTETFENFTDSLIGIAIKKFDEMDEMSSSPKLLLNSKKEPSNIVRFLTLWSYDSNCYNDYLSGGWECDPEWDLIGVLE